MDIHIPRTSKCCNVLDTFEFTRFQIAKHKARWTPHKNEFYRGTRFDAFIMSATTPPKRHNPKAWANYGYKGTTKFADMQENSEKNRYFLDNGRPWGLWDGVPPTGYGPVITW